MSIRVLMVLDGEYRFNTGSGGTPDFTYTALVSALASAGFQVTKAHRQADTTADLQFFSFTGAGVNLLNFDVLWLIGFQGRNSLSMTGTSGTNNLSDPEIAAVMSFMDSGGGVFATGDHDGIGADMCGHIPRIRAARCWYGQADAASPMPVGFPRNFPPLTAARADTTRPNPAGDYSEFAAPFIWFENQSDSVPQTITPVTTPAHPILRRNGSDITVFPDHMHEGRTLGEVPGYDYSQSITVNGQTFVEFPSVDGDQPKPEVIATGQVVGFQNRGAETGLPVGDNADVASPKSNNTLSVYEGRRAGVGRIVTGATFHHYIDINLTGDTDINTPTRRKRTGPDAAKGHGFNDNPAVFDDIKAVFVNITNWLARPKPAISLILERNTFGQDEVTVNPQFDSAVLVTVDGVKPGQFPAGGITTLSPSAAQLAGWAPAITLGAAAIAIEPTGVSSDDPSLSDRLQRITFTYRVRFIANAFGFGGQSQTIPINASLVSPAAPAPLTDSAWIQLVKSANPFMLDLDGGNPTAWLSSDLKVFRVIEGETVHGVKLPSGATRGQALQFINDLTGSISVAQFEALTGNQAASALSPFPTTTMTGKNVYNFAVARVRRNGTMAAANDVRVFFRIFTSPTTAAITYRESMGVPVDGYLKTAGAAPVPLPGVAAGQWVSFPCFAETRATAPNIQSDGNNVKTITTAQNNKFFGVLLDSNLGGSYLPSTPGGVISLPLPDLLMGEHQCLVAQVEFPGTPIPTGSNPATSDKLAQRNIAVSAVANPGINASRTAIHTFEIEATPHPISNGLQPDELVLEWSSGVPADTHINIHIPSWNAQSVVELADRFYARHEIRALDEHSIEIPAGGTRFIPIPNCLHRQTGVFTAELPLGIKKGQRFDVSIRQITNRGRNVKFPQPKIKEISLREAARMIGEIERTKGKKATRRDGLPVAKQGIYDLGNNQSLVTDLSLFDAVSDRALIIEHPDPKAVAAATLDSRLWRQTIGAFQIGIPVSTKDAMLIYHLRLFSVMTWRLAKLNRKNRWYATLVHYLDLLADKIRALGGNPFDVPPTSDGAIPQLPGKDSDQPGSDDAETENLGGKYTNPFFEPSSDDWLFETGGLLTPGTAKPGLWSGKISGLLYDHFGDFEGFTLESYAGSHVRFFSRESAIHELARTAWTERYVVTVISTGSKSHSVRRLLIRGFAD